MKRRFLFGTAVSLAFFLWAGAIAQPKKLAPTKEFMREKLGHSQSVLEGLALEDFELVANHARRLGAMSKEMGWRARWLRGPLSLRSIYCIEFQECRRESSRPAA